MPGKVNEFVEVLEAQDVLQLRAFLGLVNYYNCLLPDPSMVSTAAPTA